MEDQHTAKKAGTAPKIIYRHIRAAAESGWDFSSRWFRDGAKMETIQTTRLIPVDLNSLLYFMETLLAKAYEKQDPELSRDMLTKSEQRKEAIQEYCWNDEKDFFFDYQFAYQQQTGIYSLAAAYPLFCGCATRKQAAGVANIIEEQFLFNGGLITTLAKTGQQWDAPNGWAPLQWIAYKGLKNYGHNKLADKIKTNWLTNNEKIFATTGKMMEKYNVTNTENLAGGGEYPNQDGFGWTNGVYLALLAEGKSS
jgi:alpha,alpha-trehalase